MRDIPPVIYLDSSGGIHRFTTTGGMFQFERLRAWFAQHDIAPSAYVMYGTADTICIALASPGDAVLLRLAWG